MSFQYRAKRIQVQVCDLCGEEIPEYKTKDEIGTIMGGVMESEKWAKTPTALRKRVKLRWPPEHRPQHVDSYSGIQRREYDFHGECIVRLVEANLFNFNATEGGE